MSEDDNVIHVSFQEGKRITLAPAAPEPREVRPRTGDDDPITELYSQKEVSRLFDVSVGRLRHWDRSEFVRPSGTRGKRRCYTFQDLIRIRTALGLLDQGIALRHVRASVEALRVALPKVTRPLSSLRVVAEGGAVVVKNEVGSFEPVTGQQLLDFAVDDLREDVVRVLRHETRPVDRRAAYELYLEACRLDEHEDGWDLAEELYRRALGLDPALVTSFINLGNLRFRRGDVKEARTLYENALRVDPAQPEAHYNLGFLALEAGNADDAISRFESALEEDPAFADAHFNLALALEDVGREGAASHWEAYLSLCPSGEWADVARTRLDASLP